MAGDSSKRALRRAGQAQEAPCPSPGSAATGGPEWDKLTQREKFIRTAREVEADETGEHFERAFSRAFPPRKPGEPVPSYVEQPATKGSRRKAKAIPD